MKKLFLFLFFVPIFCSAQISLETNKDGQWRVKEDVQGWTSSEIKADSAALMYLDFFPVAIANPGKKITVDEQQSFIRLRLLFKKQIEVNKTVLYYKNKSRKMLHCLNYREIREESSYLILWSIVALSLMLIAHIVGVNKNFFIKALILLVFFNAFSASFFAATSYALFPFLFVCCAAIAVMAIFIGVISIPTVEALSTLDPPPYFPIRWLSDNVNKFLLIFYVSIIANIISLFV